MLLLLLSDSEDSAVLNVSDVLVKEMSTLVIQYIFISYSKTNFKCNVVEKSLFLYLIVSSKYDSAQSM